MTDESVESPTILQQKQPGIRAGQPSQSKGQKPHKRSLSLQPTTHTQSTNSTDSGHQHSQVKLIPNRKINNYHKRAASRGLPSHLSLSYKAALLKGKGAMFNKNTNFKSQLDTIKDERDEKGSSQCTSTQIGAFKNPKRYSRDIFNEDEEQVDVMIDQPSIDFDAKNPIPTIMEPKLKQQKSDISALGLNASEFDFNGEGNDYFEDDNSFLAKEQSFRQDEVTPNSANKSDLNNSGYINRSYTINPRNEKSYFETEGFPQIDEVNENSSSAMQCSHEESPNKLKSQNSNNKASDTNDGEMLNELMTSTDNFDDLQFDASRIRGSNTREINSL